MEMILNKGLIATRLRLNSRVHGQSSLLSMILSILVTKSKLVSLVGLP